MSDAPASLADLHNHLVPGVDDGARNTEDALEGIGRMVDAGYRRIVTTPHLDAGLTLNPPALDARLDQIREGWEWIIAEVRKRWPDLDFRQGYEVMLDVPDADFSGPRLCLDGTSFILVEWPRMHVPPRSTEVISRLRFAGLRPVVAHPERYSGVDPSLERIERWRRAGAYLQVNHGSLAGRYGQAARTTALRLLKRGWVDYLSTDFHGRPHLDLYLDDVREALEERGGDEQLALLTRTNPSRLFDDEDPLPVPPLPDERGLWDRLRGLFAGEAT